jgi:hypothetical protein
MNARPLSRREAIQRILAASALVTTFDLRALTPAGTTPGLGFDPDLLKKEIPWPRLLTEGEKRIVAALADVILPADEFGPAASAVGVPDFIDEWVSAPYEQQVKDRKIIREGLAWLETEARQRFSDRGFAECSTEQQTTLATEIVTDGTPARKQARSFFMLFRDRAAGGYYTTPEGWKAIGYTGNVAMTEFPGPPPEALKQAGLA